jgi:hypothetical protein
MAKMKKKLQKITANFTGVTRNDTMEGRDFLVAPMIMLLEGVHQGSNGPLYYPAEELSKTPQVWNMKPVVVYHPQVDGQGISACDPDVLTNRKIGVIMNTIFEGGKLKAEAWLEVNRMEKVDKRVAEAVENGTMLELSTGLFTDNEDVAGEWNGEKYDAIARNYRPDHLAILPDVKGACSIEDGAGFLRLNEAGDNIVFDLGMLKTEEKEFIEANGELLIRRLQPTISAIVENEMSFEQTRELLSAMLRIRGDMLWVEAVYETFFIYEDADKLYKQNYKISDGSAIFEDDKIEVVRVTEYRDANGKFIATN